MVGRAALSLGQAAVACVLLILGTTPALAQSSEPDYHKRQQIREFMAITGSMDMADQMMNDMLRGWGPLFEQLNAEQGEFVASTLQNEFIAVFRERKPEFEDLLVDVYDEQFTAEEVAGLLEFYRSPLGLALLEKLPIVFSEARQSGQELGRQVAEEAYDRAMAAIQAQGSETPH